MSINTVPRLVCLSLEESSSYFILGKLMTNVIDNDNKVFHCCGGFKEEF